MMEEKYGTKRSRWGGLLPSLEESGEASARKWCLSRVPRGSCYMLLLTLPPCRMLHLSGCELRVNVSISSFFGGFSDTPQVLKSTLLQFITTFRLTVFHLKKKSKKKLALRTAYFAWWHEKDWQIAGTSACPQTCGLALKFSCIVSSTGSPGISEGTKVPFWSRFTV